MVKVICIDEENRPKEIPSEKWPKEGQEYTITFLHWHPMQGVQGVDLKELSLGKECYPFETYKLSRFALPQDQVKTWEEFVEASIGMKDLDLKELELEVI